jgi:large repetitive protein
MTTSRRAPARREVAKRRRSFLGSSLGSSQRLASPRRRYGVEALEPRALLAADSGIFISDYWNYKNPTDVNDDGNTTTMDLLAIVNAITDGGVRTVPGMVVGGSGGAAPAGAASLSGASTGEGEGPGDTKYYVDANNDGLLNMLDLLSIVNEMTGEGEGDPALIRYKIEPVIAGTNTPLPTNANGQYLIQEGEYYELRVFVQDTGVPNFGALTRPATFDPDLSGPQPPKTAYGLTSAFLDLNFDTSKTQVEVVETQIVEIVGTPTGDSTTFTLTFDGQTTAPITYSDIGVFTAVNIRNALVTMLAANGTTDISGLRNVDVEPETPASPTRFRVRFIHDLANENHDQMTGALVNADGATSVAVTTVVEGDPNNPSSFREMFRGRFARNQNSPSLPIINNPQFFDTDAQPPFISGDNVANGVNDAGSISESSLNPSGDRSGTQLVELFRLRMKATDGDGSTPVSLVGSVTNLNLTNNFNSIHGFTAVIPANRIVFDQDGDFMADPAPQLLITEPVSAVNDSREINESVGASVTIDVMANDLDSQGPVVTSGATPRGDLVLVSFTQPAFGTVTQNGNQLVYTVPDGDFNGVATFQYTIRDGANPSITDTGTVTVTVKATNDSPTISVPGPQNIGEDQAGGLIFSVGTGNEISISDVDAGSADVRITLTTTGGTLALNAAATGDLTSVSGNGTLALPLVAVGTVTEINAALSGLRFTPTANFNGATSLDIAVSDLGNSAHIDNAVEGTANASIAINVAAGNDPPVNSVPGAQTIDEGATLTFNVANSNLISVTDVDADAGTPPFLTVTLSTSQGGLLTADVTSGASITNNGTASVTISGTVAQVNDALSGLTYFRANPTTDILTVATSDNGNTGSGGIRTDSDPITINVLATSRPRAIDDVFPVGAPILEGVAFVDLDVLANDLSNIGETLHLQSFVAPPGFTVEIRPADGTIPRDYLRLTPLDADFFGQVSIEYTMFETDNVPPGGTQLPNSGPDVGLVTVTITNVNDAPVGVVDTYSTNEDDTLTVAEVAALGGVLNNDTDADNRPSQPPVDTLTAELVAGSAVGGSVSLNSDGTFSFTPTANFNGTASFQYRVLDGQGGVSANTLVTINVAAVADAPVANPDSYQTNEAENLTVLAATGLLANDSDADNLTPPANAGLTVATFTQPAQGSVAVNPDGSFTYTLPNSDFNGQVTFTYQAQDGTGLLSPPATVTITIFPVNDPPVAGNATYLAVENQTRTVTAAEGLLRTTNPIVTDVDTPLSGITVEVVTPPAVGTFNLSANGAFTYTPPTEFNGQVTFTYRASDGPGSFSNVGTITIDIAAVNNAPTANPDEFSTDEDTAITITPAQLLGDDTDPENNTLAISSVTGFSGPGTLVQNGDGSLTFTPAPGFPAPSLTGNVTFQYTVTDGPNQSNAATVTITVNERNDAPIANDDTANDVVKNEANQLIVPNPIANDSSGQDTGVSGEVLVITSVGGVGGATQFGGTVTLGAGGQVFYTPATNFIGVDTFVYTLSDSRGGTDTATVTVEVLDFVPKSVSGRVFIDIDNDGVFEPSAGDKPVAGVRIDLVGATILGALTRDTTTDANGNYSFSILPPGSYTLTQAQPLTLTSGNVTANTSLATADSITGINVSGNSISFGWSALDFDGNITGLNFSERGINSANLDDASGLIGEILTSSGPSGMVFSVDALGSMDWSYTLSGWNTTAGCQLEIAANGAIPSLLLTIGGVTKRIYQDPHNNQGGSTPPTGSQARFRILGTTASGEYIIRLDGTLAEFGFVAAAPVEMGEGESTVEMSDGQYREAADEVFAGEAWA